MRALLRRTATRPASIAASEDAPARLISSSFISSRSSSSRRRSTTCGNLFLDPKAFQRGLPLNSTILSVVVDHGSRDGRDSGDGGGDGSVGGGLDRRCRVLGSALSDSYLSRATPLCMVPTELAARSRTCRPVTTATTTATPTAAVTAASSAGTLCETPDSEYNESGLQQFVALVSEHGVGGILIVGGGGGRNGARSDGSDGSGGSGGNSGESECESASGARTRAAETLRAAACSYLPHRETDLLFCEDVEWDFGWAAEATGVAGAVGAAGAAGAAKEAAMVAAHRRTLEDMSWEHLEEHVPVCPSQWTSSTVAVVALQGFIDDELGGWDNTFG